MGNASGAPTAYESTWRQYVASPGGTIQRAGLAVAGHSDRERLVATQATRALSPTGGKATGSAGDCSR